MRRSLIAAAIVLTTAASTALRADEIADAIQALHAIQPGGGVQSIEAQKAVDALAGAAPRSLTPILNGFSKASPLAANWLRNAFEEAVAQLKVEGTALPAAELEAFAADVKNDPAARRLAYETVKAVDPEIEQRLIPGMLLDPGSEFRRDAVARLIEAAGKAEGASSAELYRRALSGAVHEDQVQKIAEELRKAGETVEISRHFGFVSNWMIAGPFDNKEEKGFAVAYAPEAEFESTGPRLDAEYDGQLGKVKWAPIATEDDYGIVDIAKSIENYKGSLMYATTTWKSDRDQTLQIRLGTPNAWKLWVNGKMVFEREEYHRSSQMDQYLVTVNLKAGDNTIGIKVCQNEQAQEWAQRYQFQLRVCDSTGVGVLPVTQTAGNLDSENQQEVVR